MVTNQKPTGRAFSIPSGLALGTGVSITATILIAVILAWLLEGERMKWETVGYGIMILLFLSSFLGSAVSAQSVKRQRLLVSLMSGTVYFGLLLSVTALFFGGKYQAVGVTAILILGGSGCAGLLVLPCKAGRKGKKPKIRYR